MKNRTILLLLCLLAFFSCKKDAKVNSQTFKIENEKVEAETQSVKITGTYVYSGTIDGIDLELGRQTDLMDSDEYRLFIEDKDFSVEVRNLRSSTTYYYRYLVEYGASEPYKTEIKSFTTLDYNMPLVTTVEVSSVGVNRAEVKGKVEGDDGGDAVTLRGICWSLSHNPSVGDAYTNSGEGIGEFACELTGLQPNKTYYARAFAGNSQGVAYGEELTFVTMAAGSLPEVKTVGITGNAMLQATVNGEVTAEGASPVMERGVCYAKNPLPTTNDLHVGGGAGLGEFSCQLTGLEANTTYYVRAYAINSLGVSYGEELSFLAMAEATIPTVVTNMVNGITGTSATGHGIVVSDGGATVTRRGLCWSENPQPTADGTHADCGSGVGTFSSLMPHLLGMTTYYVRAYAENAIGIAYGDEISFTVGQHEYAELPIVRTFEVMDIMQTTAIAAGEVLSDGGAEVTERGLCWSTSHEPTTDDSHASNGAGTGSYSVQMTDLEPDATYYVRAYARNSVGTAYGDEVEFTTLQEVSLPSVMTFEVFDITQTTAIGGGEVMDEGGSYVYERGLCWSTSHNPTLDDSHASNGEGGGFFEIEMTDLAPNTTYYVKAYAVNEAGICYGDEVSFVTLTNDDVLIEDFERGDFSLFNWENDSYYPWQITTFDPYEGIYCIKSGNQNVLNSSSTIQVTMNIPANSEMSFFSKISSEYNNDFGFFYIDGELMASFSGDGSWSIHTFPITAGEHTFTWKYEEDGMISGYDDCFYVDYITFYGDVLPTPNPHNSIIIDFETGDFSQYDFDNTVSNYPWTVTNNSYLVGTYCIKSTNGGVPNSTSAIEVIVPYNTDGLVSFAASCHGEGTSTIHDHCDFFIDGERVFYHGAESVGWNMYSYLVTAGTHTFRWEYTKDSSVNPTGDCFYVDRIIFAEYRKR